MCKKSNLIPFILFILVCYNVLEILTKKNNLITDLIKKMCCLNY